jgi:hypothetical protein
VNPAGWIEFGRAAFKFADSKGVNQLTCHPDVIKVRQPAARYIRITLCFRVPVLPVPTRLKRGLHISMPEAI